MITIYGRDGDACSFTTVTSGWVDGLSRLSKTTGPADRPRLITRSENMQSAMDAPDEIAIITDPHLLPIAKIFDHLHFLVVLAPHSAFLPAAYLEMMRNMDPLLVPPSEFCAKQLRLLDPHLTVAVVPHGVDVNFFPVTNAQHRALRGQSGYGPAPELASLRGPGINFLHLAAGDIDRKGTEALIQAFLKAVAGGLDATLTCVLAGQERARIASTLLRSGVSTPLYKLPRDRSNGRVRLLPRVNAQPDKMRWFYSTFDAIIQPSRVEGFGMCPLEALCCGVPAIVTSGTGHLQWLDACDEGVVTIPLGPDGPMASEPNPCPTVEVDAILQAILRMSHELAVHTEAAVGAFQKRKRLFDWATVIGQLMQNPGAQGRSEND